MTAPIWALVTFTASGECLVDRTSLRASRRMADRCARFDPRMAADIYCAADRHETGG